MNRRSFFKGMLAAAAAVVTRRYAPAATLPVYEWGDDVFCVLGQSNEVRLRREEMDAHLDAEMRPAIEKWRGEVLVRYMQALREVREVREVHEPLRTKLLTGDF